MKIEEMGRGARERGAQGRHTEGMEGRIGMQVSQRPGKQQMQTSMIELVLRIDKRADRDGTKQITVSASEEEKKKNKKPSLQIK